MNDVKEISPWDLIEGVKTTSNALPLAVYGAARIERKPLKYEEQFQLVQVHSHKRQLATHNFVYIADQKDLPAANPPVDGASGAPGQEDELEGTETLNGSSSEQTTGQEQVKNPQSNVTMMMPQQQRGDHMIQQARAQQIASQAAAAMGTQSHLHHNMSAPTAAVGSGPMGSNVLVRHSTQMTQQGYNHPQGMMGGAGAYQQMSKPSGYPPPYQQPRPHDMIQWNNAGPGGGAVAYENKRKEQLKAIQIAAIGEAKKQQILNSMQGRGFGTNVAGQLAPQPGMSGMQANVVRNQNNMQDYLNQFPADQRNAVYQQFLRRRHQQMQAMQQHQPHTGMAMGGAVRGNFVRQPAGYPNQMTTLRPRPGMVQGYGGLQQQQQAVAAVRQQQLYQIRQQQQFQQQQQFGGGAGYNQF